MNALPRVGPPEDGLRLALATARHRRLRAAGTTTSLTAAALSVAVLALGAPGSQTLLQQPAPQRPAVSTIVQGEDGVAPEARTDGPGHLSNPAGAAAHAGDPRPTPSPAPTAEGAVAQPVRPGGQGSRYAAGPLTKQENYLGIPSCPVSTSTQSTMTLCPSTMVNDYGTSLGLYADVCSTRTSPTTLHFPGRNEVDFAITRQGDTVWRWADWHPDGGAPHSRVLETGACTSWTFGWTLVDAQGKRLPKGTYTLRTTFLAEELGGPMVLGTSFTIS